jgi:hypothetical protein
MRGYVIQEKGRADWRDVLVPELGPYDALVRLTAVATCTTDVHLIDSLSLSNALGKAGLHDPSPGAHQWYGDLQRRADAVPLLRSLALVSTAHHGFHTTWVFYQFSYRRHGPRPVEQREFLCAAGGSSTLRDRWT